MLYPPAPHSTSSPFHPQDWKSNCQPHPLLYRVLGKSQDEKNTQLLIQKLHLEGNTDFRKGLKAGGGLLIADLENASELGNNRTGG